MEYAFNAYSKLVKCIGKQIGEHGQALALQLDPIQPLEGKTMNVKIHLMFPMFILVFTAIFGSVGLHIEGGGSLDRWDDFIKSPYLFTHQVVPRPIWSPFDFCLALDIVSTFSIYLTLIVNPKIKEKYLIYQTETGKLFANGKGK